MTILRSEVKAELARHELLVAGHQRIDGVDAIKLVDSTGSDILWVNARNYLPVRFRFAPPHGHGGRFPFADRPATGCSRPPQPGLPCCGSGCRTASKGSRPSDGRPHHGAHPGARSGMSTATHSTWWVMGKMSNARSPSNRQPSPANTARSRARVAGSHDT